EAAPEEEHREPATIEAEPEPEAQYQETVTAETEAVPPSPPAGTPEVEATVAESTPAPTPEPPSKPELELDPEMLGIFIEEAREVLEMINNEFPSWRDNPDNGKALAEVRRGLHTLKGSGRMVGAWEIGELTWAVENLLNNVRDGKIAHSDMIFDLVAKVNHVLPSMIDQLEGGPAPVDDIEALRQGAHALANGEPLPTLVATAKEEEIAIEEEVTATSAPIAEAEKYAPAEVEEAFPQLDDRLLRIFTSETLDHLETIRQEVAGCREGGGHCLVSAGLLRATHTLQGSARSVGLPLMSEPCGEMERLLQTLEALRFPLDDSHFVLLDDMVACVSDLIDVLNDESRPAGDVRSRFDALRDRIAEQIAPLPAPELREEPEAEMVVEPTPAVAKDSDVPEAPPTPEAPAGGVSEEADETSPVAVADSTVTSAAATPAVPVGIEEDIDPELVDVFLEEAEDLLSSVEEAVTQWRGNQADAQAVESLKRALHTLKGGARMASANVVGNLAHSTEDLVKRVEDHRIAASAGLFDLLDEVHDILVTLIDQIRHAQPLSSVEAVSAKIARALAGEPIAESKAGARSPSAREDQPGVSVAARTPAADVAGEAADAEGTTEADTAIPRAAAEHVERRGSADADGETLRERRDRRGQVRVRTSVLTDLVNYAGEVSIARARMEQQIYGFRDNLGELNRNVTRFRDQLRDLEIQSESQILYRTEIEGESELSSGFDPLELDRYSRLQQLSRSLAESLHDLTTIQSNLQTFAGEAETVLQQQARTNTSLQEGLMRTRMIPFSTQAARLRHISRQTARELGKRVELKITGTEVDVDRNVLERMMGPFEHMIRNSLDHGIENELERRRAGKPPMGTITIDTSQEGNEIAIRFSDDGRGLDIEAIRRRALENELITEDKVLSDDELIQFILVSGFSTAREVTHLSGRGVGMDVVENEVKQLGGHMAVNTTPREGTTFTIRLPVTLSIAQALIVRVSDQPFAIPLSAIMNIIEVPADQVNVSMGKNPLLNYNDTVYAFMNVGNRLGFPSEPRNGGKVPVLLARIGTREVAIQVDALIGTKEIVVKSLGPQLSELKGLAGATVLGDGTVILILDIGGLWLTDEALQVEHVAETAPGEQTTRRPVVMVVDDSLTVRKVTGRHLQKRGLEVLTAKDGVDALEQLQDHTADVMLIDIEMPRMDGYELSSRIRADPRFKHIPIIIITSRAGEKHRNRAFELGVNGYMSKPYQEDELFQNIESLLSEDTVH
ncbi:MAG: Hpt domain-containing protein, partial [Acidiferrobacterales bacterium]